MLDVFFMYILIFSFRQRFSISGLFYKASRDRKRSSAIYQESIDETVVPDRRMLSASADSNISFDEDGFGGGDSTITSTGKSLNYIQVVVLIS